MIDFPTLEEVNNFGNLEYDEGRGSSFIRKILEPKQKTYFKDFSAEKLYSSFRRNPSYEKMRIPWIQGLISSSNPNFFEDIFLSKNDINTDALNYDFKSKT